MKLTVAKRVSTIVLALIVVSSLRSQAQTAVSWNGGSGNWNTAGDWSGGVVPNNGGGKTYNVTISNGTSEIVTLNLGVTISDLTLGTSATLQSSGSNSLTIASGGTFTNSGTLDFNTGTNVLTVQSGGSLINNSSMTFSGVGSGLNVTGTTTNGASANLSMEGGSTSTFTGNVNNSGIFQTGFSGGNNTVNVSGTFTNNAGAQLLLSSSGDAVNINALSNSGILTVGSGATLTITGGGNGLTDVVAGSNDTITGTFNVKNGTTTTSAIAKLTSVEGELTLNNGKTTNAITPTSGTLTISSTGNFGVEAATTLALTGNVNNSGTFSTGFSGGNNTVTVSGTFTNNAGATASLESAGDVLNVKSLANSGTFTIDSGTTLNLTGGGQGITDVLAGSQLTVDGTLNVKNGTVFSNGLGNLTSVEGKLSLNNGITNAITPNGGTLTIASAGSLGLSNGATSNTTLTITGNVNNSGSFSTGFSGGTNTVNVSGTFTNAAGATMNLDSNTDNVNVNALTNAGVLQIGSAPGSTATLTITGGGQGVTDIVAGSTLTLDGNLNVKNGTTTSSGLGHLTSVEGVLNLQNAQSNAVTPTGGTLSIASGATVSVNDATTLAITGNVNNSGTFTEGFLNASNTVTVSGTFTNATNSLLTVEGNGDVMSVGVLNNSGTVSITPGVGSTSSLVITGSGTLTNSGSINVAEGTLKFNNSSASLTGGGTVTLGTSNASATGVIQVGATNTGTLTNVNNTITGFGNLGNGTLTLVNQGTINANGIVSSGALTVQPGSSGMTNTGTLEATNQATLILNGTFNNTGGTIQALGESGGGVTPTVQLLTGTVINGGTLTTSAVGTNSGLVEAMGNVTLNGVTNAGFYSVNAGTTTTLKGTITNSGSISLNGSTLSLATSVPLNGKGTVILSNSASNLITGAAGGLTLTNANTIEGSGTISNLGIVNTGTLMANQSVPFIILPSSGGLNNTGTLSVSTGDTMQIGTSAGGALLNFSGTTLTGGTYSASGTLQFGASGTSVVTDAANISLTGSGAKIIDFGGHSVLTNLATITSAGSFSISGGANFTTVGGFTNNGKLTANAGSTFSIAGALSNFNSSTNTLTGGSFTAGGKIKFAGANIVTDAANITLNGTGEIVNSSSNGNGLANLATITGAGSFTLGSKANFTTVGNLTANGRLTVNSGSTLTIAGTLTNFNGSTNTLSSGIYNIGGTMEFTGANIVNNAANLTITGSTAKILSGSANGLANFANNSGTFTVTGNGSFATGSAAFNNSGSVTVAKGSTLTVGGGNSYNQSAGTTTVDGTLTGNSGINVTGGKILGAGKLGGNVTVGGSGTTPTISAGDSGKAGLLAITSNYTQLSTATMNTFVGGTTVGTQYSQLQVGGTASLAGTLTVTLASGFIPTIGSTFTVLTGAAVTGTFSNSTIAINGTEHFNVSYTSTGVVLTVASGSAPVSGGLSQHALSAVTPTRTKPLLISSLRDRVGIRVGGTRFLVAGLGGRAAHTSAMPIAKFSLSRSESWNRPASSSPLWGHKTAVPVTIAQVPTYLQRNVAASSPTSNWAIPGRGVSMVHAPVAASQIRRMPVRMIPSTMPRMGR